MSANTFIQKLRENVRKFSAAQGGNITIIFALTTIPVMGFVGAAVDYSRANSAKSAMQAAVDATALMLSKEVTTLTATQMSQKANAYFAALFNRTEVAGITITPVYTTSGGSQLVVTGTGTVPTSFTKVMGFQQLAINVSSTVKWGNTRLRVALALDNTGSMADDGKITALKTATKNLLSQLKAAAANNGDVYVSIIPFSKDVNVGAAQLQRQLDRLERLGRRQRPRHNHPDLHLRRRARTARRRRSAPTPPPGCPTTTTPGTAASPTATRTTTPSATYAETRRPPVFRTPPRRRCSRPSNTTPARCR